MGRTLIPFVSHEKHPKTWSVDPIDWRGFVVRGADMNIPKATLHERILDLVEEEVVTQAVRLGNEVDP